MATPEELGRRRAMIAAMLRCIHATAIAIERPWTTCPKAACARSHRCRGRVCGARPAARPERRESAR